MWFLPFCFWTSGSVAKRSSTSENHYLFLNEDSLFETEIAPLHAYFLLQVAITSLAFTLAIFWTPLTENQSARERNTFLSESRITWTHQGVRWIPVPAQGKRGDDFHGATSYQVAKFGTLFWLSEPPITPCEHSLLHGDVLRVNMPWVTM